METQNSNSEIISPENNYKFDNYGIVMADSIEDLLYDKYHNRRKRKSKTNGLSNDSSEIIDQENTIENDIKKSLIEKSHSLTNNEKEEEKEEKEKSEENKENKKKDDESEENEESEEKEENEDNNEDEDNIFNERAISNNINLHYKNYNIKSNKSIKSKNNGNNIDDKNKIKIKDKINLENEEKGNNIGNEIGTKNEENSNTNKDNEENKKIIKNNQKNKLKMIRCKEFQIKNKYINKEEPNNNKPIKIILNINNKEKKELDINPSDCESVKNISINTNLLSNNEEMNNSNKYKKDKKEKEKYKLKIKKETKEEDDNIEKVSNHNHDEKDDILNNNKKYKFKMFLKNIKLDNKIIINSDNKTQDKKTQKINLISPSEINNKNTNNNEKKRNKSSNKKNRFYNVPISSQSYIVKMRRSSELIFNKMIPKKKRIFITKVYMEKKKSKNIKLTILPKSTLCYFKKEKKIINVKTHIPLQNVLNKYYFCTKKIDIYNEKNHKKVFIRRISNSKIEKYNKDENEEEFEIDDNKIKSNDQNNKIKNRNRKAKIKGKTIDISKYSNSPSIIIKIINPLNSSYKYGKIDIKTNSSKNKEKSNSCQRFYFSNLNKKKILPLNINNNKKKIRKLKSINNNNRYESNKEITESQFLKNKEIVKALNNSSKYKGYCFACFTLNKRKKYAEKLQKKLRLKRNYSKNDKLEKIKSLRPKSNVNNLKRILNSKNEEEKIERSMIKKFTDKIDTNIKGNIIPKANKIIYDKRNRIMPHNSISCNSMNKYSNFAHIEFPAIESYFH